MGLLAKIAEYGSGGHPWAKWIVLVYLCCSALQWTGTAKLLRNAHNVHLVEEAIMDGYITFLPSPEQLGNTTDPVAWEAQCCHENPVSRECARKNNCPYELGRKFSRIADDYCSRRGEQVFISPAPSTFIEQIALQVSTQVEPMPDRCELSLCYTADGVRNGLLNGFIGCIIITAAVMSDVVHSRKLTHAQYFRVGLSSIFYSIFIGTFDIVEAYMRCAVSAACAYRVLHMCNSFNSVIESSIAAFLILELDDKVADMIPARLMRPSILQTRSDWQHNKYLAEKLDAETKKRVVALLDGSFVPEMDRDEEEHPIDFEAEEVAKYDGGVDEIPVGFRFILSVFRTVRLSPAINVGVASKYLLSFVTLSLYPLFELSCDGLEDELRFWRQFVGAVYWVLFIVFVTMLTLNSGMAGTHLISRMRIGWRDGLAPKRGERLYAFVQFRKVVDALHWLYIRQSLGLSVIVKDDLSEAGGESEQEDGFEEAEKATRSTQLFGNPMLEEGKDDGEGQTEAEDN